MDDTDDLAAARGIMVAGAGGLLFWVLVWFFGGGIGGLLGNFAYVLLRGTFEYDGGFMAAMAIGAGARYSGAAA